MYTHLLFITDFHEPKNSDELDYIIISLAITTGLSQSLLAAFPES